jgi:hypothetical protein
MAKRKPPRVRLPEIHSLDDAIAIIKQLVCDEHTEGQLLLGIDWRLRLCGATFRCPCDRCDDELLSDAADLVAYAEDVDAIELVLVTFVEPGRLAPTAADVARFEGLRVECAADDVELLDHLLISGHRWRSIRELSAAPGA